MARRRRAIFGGSFNPPHVGHQLVCAYVLATARPAVDVLWMVPTFHHPFGKSLAPYADRVAMCQRAAAIFGGRVEVSRIEEELGGESYTLSTVKAMHARFPGDDIAVIIGADLLAERERWHGYAELATLADFIVVGRSGTDVNPFEEPHGATGVVLPGFRAAVGELDRRAGAPRRWALRRRFGAADDVAGLHRSGAGLYRSDH